MKAFLKNAVFRIIHTPDLKLIVKPSLAMTASKCFFIHGY